MDAKLIAALVSERDELVRKLEALNSVIAAYGGGDGLTTAAPPIRPLIRVGSTYRSVSEKTLKIRKLIRDHIYVWGDTPTPTRELVEFLRANGVTVGGKNEVATLSALLSNSEGFKSIGRNGWIFVGPAHDTEPDANEALTDGRP